MNRSIHQHLNKHQPFFWDKEMIPICSSSLLPNSRILWQYPRGHPSEDSNEWHFSQLCSFTFHLAAIQEWEIKSYAYKGPMRVTICNCHSVWPCQKRYHEAGQSSQTSVATPAQILPQQIREFAANIACSLMFHEVQWSFANRCLKRPLWFPEMVSKMVMNTVQALQRNTG